MVEILGVIFFVVFCFGIPALIVYPNKVWWLPYTRIKTNGLRYQVQQLNRCHIWQEIGSSTSLDNAIFWADFAIKDWHEDNDKYRQVTNVDLVASKIEQANKE